MRAKTLIPDPDVITIEQIVSDDTDIVLVARTRRCTVPCPVCGQSATRIHSWYTRSLRDLPWQGLAVRMGLHTRRWFCDNPCCPRRIFTERLPTVAAPFSQRTTRLATIVLIFGVAVGGAPGARLLAENGSGRARRRGADHHGVRPGRSRWRGGQATGRIGCHPRRAHPAGTDARGALGTRLAAAHGR